MEATPIETDRLTITPKNLEEVRAMIEAMDAATRAEVSADWLAKLDEADPTDPWTMGFTLVLRGSDVAVGTAGFKGPPTPEGIVEIAYGVEPDHQGHGFATEAAKALTDWAFASGRVRVVRAHTLPAANASTRVLSKSGFRHLGEVIDPEDGLVWRWERLQPSN